jgi:pimeloyl-ACP methyl ester carboxylesterase
MILTLSAALLGARLMLAPAATTLALEPCRITNAGRSRSVAARCGRYPVPENPQAPEGRTIELFVAVVPALDVRPGPDALTVLAGGPGAAATEFYVDYAPAFDRVHRRRDILLVDQRGTGGSHRLECADTALALDAGPQDLRDAAQHCVAQLDADPRWYTTSIAVRDLDAVRAALGYAQLDLYGASYGSRVALHYLRRYPAQTRSLILDGVLPANVALGPEIALDAQHALEEVFARCGADTACNGSFPDLRGRFEALHTRLGETPLALTLADPRSAEPIEIRFGPSELDAAVRLLSYTTDTTALLPLLLDRAAAGEVTPLAAQSLMVARSLGDTLAEGMHNSIVCAEDVPFFAIDDAQRAALAATYLGTAQVDALAAICEVWPRGLVDPDFKSPVAAPHPALLLSGGADPVTPPRNGEQALATLPHGLHLVAEGQGHGVAALGCVPRIVAEFIDAASVDGLDTSCVSRLRPAPFFTSFNGPGP